MDIEIAIEHRHLKVSPAEQALAQAAASRDALKVQFLSQLASKSLTYTLTQTLGVNPNTLKLMVRKYSEQLVYQPLEELQFWFSYSSGVFLEPGYPPLYYSRKPSGQSISPNKSAIAAIGEGVAGLVGQQLYQGRKLARPIHDYPDIVMLGNKRVYLLESKATTLSKEDIKRVIDDELVRMIVYASACADLDKQTTVVGVLVGTALLGETCYRTYITEVSV
ncbi:MAG: hypothetical protein KME43_13985 [Myxacorys chilensis ATA2-1-KO14]|nr:hypothetical protein [Myxacorys chilensis ATA2-1-KO14]